MEEVKVKKKKLKVKNLIIIISILLLIIASVIIMILFPKQSKKSNNENTTTKPVEVKLEILELTNDVNDYVLKYTNLIDVDHYIIDITDANLNKVISDTVENNEYTFSLNDLSYGNTYEVHVDALLKDGKTINAVSPYIFTWNEPSISKENQTVINNGTYKLKIDGEIHEGLNLVVKTGDKVLYNETLTSNEFTIPTSYYKNKAIELECSIILKDKTISDIKIYNNKNPISDITILTPDNKLKNEITDIVLTYKGGDSAISRSISLFENNTLIKKVDTMDKTFTFEASLFQMNKSYHITIDAKNGNYSKSKSVYFRFGEASSNGREAMVNLAREQLGNKGNKYYTWWGYSYRVEWCAIFISWLAEQNGYLGDVIPRFQGVGEGVKWFKARGQFENGHSSYIPRTGDIIFFDWNDNAKIDHVGIVESVDDTYVYTIEGNSGFVPNDACKRKQYKLTDVHIYGYGVPNY